MTVYGYLRVSTDKQDCDNQKVGVEALAEKLSLPIESWIVDNGVSETKEPEKTTARQAVEENQIGRRDYLFRTVAARGQSRSAGRPKG